MITVIGSINLDLVANVGLLPRPGETVPGDGFKTSPGGKGANQALAVKRAGGEVRMVGAVGQDAFADEALACLREGLVDLSGVRESHSTTGTATILVAKDGENMIAVVPGANGSLVPGDIKNVHLEKGDWLLLQHEIPMRTVKAALEEAKRVGATSILNTAPFRPEAAEFLQIADYVVANETEFDAYAELRGIGASDRRAAMREMADKTGTTIVVTLGAAGVMAAVQGGMLEAQGLKIEPVDTVGAGDTFCGYLAASLAEGMKLEDALRRAAVAGSLACLKPGAQSAIPQAKDVQEAMG
ncbi:MAG: ribokinase [Aliihoeflea sp.]|uniref:ribokinase n=1 Tax=Aliihoeflea sp. TaxID=2608088 RepID=UPI0040347536